MADRFKNNYDSDFDSDAGQARAAKRARRTDLAEKPRAPRESLPHKSTVTQEYCKAEGIIHRQAFLSLDAYSRHKMLVNHYLMFTGKSINELKRDTSKDKTDMDVIQENHRFLWDEDDVDGSWERNLAKRYYDKLFKEYCIADLSRYKENKVAMRWRIEKEVVSGKGQFMCGNKKCEEKEGLRSWEVNFGYVEHGERKNALVKIRLCPDCSYKLNYHHKRKEIKAKKKAAKKLKKYGDKAQDSSCANEEESDVRAESSADSAGDASTRTAAATGATARSNVDDDDVSAATTTTATDEAAHWSKPAPQVEDKSREEEYDEYLEDMFL